MTEVDPDQIAGDEIDTGVDANPSSDPLDAIEDPQALRSEAKKYRSIAQRKSTAKVETPAPTPAPTPVAAPESDALTKTDFYRANTRNARNMAQGELAEHWDEAIAYYQSRRGQDTPEDILKDMQTALGAMKSDPDRKQPADNPGAALATTAVPRSKGGTAPAPKPTLPIQKQQKMKDWFPKKEA